MDSTKDDCRARCALLGSSHKPMSPLAGLGFKVDKGVASEDSSWVTWSLLLPLEELDITAGRNTSNFSL